MASRRKRLPPNISRIDYARFFASAFVGGTRAARQFHDSLSSAGGQQIHNALLIMNHTARLLWLADRVERVARGRPGLQIMFFMIAAEAVAKLFDDYAGEGDSKRYALRFFASICSQEHRDRLVALSSGLPHAGSSPTAVAEHLYRIRCDVAHRWRYFGLNITSD